MKVSESCVNCKIFQIEDYILRDDKDLPLILVGEAGCGKSSVLCKLADDLCTKLKQGELKRLDKTVLFGGKNESISKYSSIKES